MGRVNSGFGCATRKRHPGVELTPRASIYWPGWRSTLVMVQPETVVRWHRTAWRGYWTWKSRARHPGRPRISKELQGLIARIATENPRWGAVRIQGELLALGYEVSAETVTNINSTRIASRRPAQPGSSRIAVMTARTSAGLGACPPRFRTGAFGNL